MPRRKILLSTGSQNYRPPLERSKSAPKLFAIEEMVNEEDEEDLDDVAKSKRSEEKIRKGLIKACCKEDHLYPSITLGRRRCRRGHSIRRPRLHGDALNPQIKLTNNRISSAGISTKESIQRDVKLPKDNDEKTSQSILQLEPVVGHSSKKSGSDEDFEAFLLNQNYNTNDFLAGDMISYFDRKLNDSSAEITPDSDIVTVSMSDLLNADYILHDQQRNSISMNDLNNYQFSFDYDEEDNELAPSKSFDQDLVLETLIRHSQDTFGEFESPNQSITSEQSNTPVINECRNIFIFKRQFLTGDDHLETTLRPTMSISNNDKMHLDNYEESSIVSGCDLISPNSQSSTNKVVVVDEEQKKSENPPIFRSGSVQDRVRNFEMLASSRTLNSNFANCNRNQANVLVVNNRELCLSRKSTLTPVDKSMADGRDKNRDDESEMSDESGFVEFQDLSLKSVYA